MALEDKYGTTFFEYDGEYYGIKTWADYYYWYINKYSYLFTQPEVYEFFYNTRNNLGMVHFLSCNFKGKKYPSKFCYNSIIKMTEDEISKRGKKKYYPQDNKKNNVKSNGKTVYSSQSSNHTVNNRSKNNAFIPK